LCPLYILFDPWKGLIKDINVGKNLMKRRVYRGKPVPEDAWFSVFGVDSFRLSSYAFRISRVNGDILFFPLKSIRHSCPKTVLRLRVLGVSFQAQTICPEVVERPFDRLTVLSHIEGHLIFTYMSAAPQNELI